MKLACCVWALSGTEIEILEQVKSLGFRTIDIQPQMLRSEESLEKFQELGLQVSCVGASFNMPAGASLDVKDEAKRQIAVNHVIDSMAHAQELNASVVYVVPEMDDSQDALNAYGNSMRELATRAGSFGLKLCIEHFPGRALATAQQTLQFIREINHPNLYLLLDVGHIQMSQEDPQTVIMDAGQQLGYVHLDDNDGVGDLHWSLLDGVMTEDDLRQTFRALESIQYDGMISLELSPSLSDPSLALQKSKEIVLNLSDKIQ